MKIVNPSVPFLSSSAINKDVVLLIDNNEIPLDTDFKQLINNLPFLKIRGKVVFWENAACIIEYQYNAALEHIYSHPFWKLLLEDVEQQRIYTYLLETRHYLKAAVSRMGKGVAKSLVFSSLNHLIAEHTLEEVNHNIFYENALKKINCNIDVIKNARPLPATLEWIHLMRTVSSKNPLVAAICSGLLEHTAKNRQVVANWHDALKDKGVLQGDAVDAIYNHVKIDISLGHGENWRDALQQKRYLSIEELVECLNSITYVAEIIYRWCDNINSGTGYAIVNQAIDDTSNSESAAESLSYMSISTVFPAQVYHDMFYKNKQANGMKSEIAKKYAYLEKYPFENNMQYQSAEELASYLKGWLRSINTHALWTSMQEQPSYALVCGWLMENYHYISLIDEHVGMAMANCTDAAIQDSLVKHLKEETDHKLLLEDSLKKTIYGDVTTFRPLATTLAFTGSLADLAQRNWKAYCLALCFLQLSISNDNNQEIHKEFYNNIIKQNSRVEMLMKGMMRHDEVDQKLGHEDDANKLVELIFKAGFATPVNMREAALIPTLAWSFLDGIRAHYIHGDLAVCQRIAWSYDYDDPTS